MGETKTRRGSRALGQPAVNPDPRRRWKAVTALLAATAMTLAACGGQSDQAAPPPAETETVTVERGAPSPSRAETSLKRATETATATDASDAADAADGLTAMDPDSYLTKGYVIFQYSTGGSLGECAIGDRGVSCQGSPGGDVPDVKVPGFTKGRATSVSARPSGVDYAVYADMPAATYSLPSGHQVTYKGTTCRAENADTLTCSNSGNSFSIKGAARAVSTNVQPKGEYFSGTTGGSGNSGSTTRTKADSSAVNCREGQRTWQIVSGNIGCAEAVDIGLRYMGAVDRGEGEGNTAYVQMGQWACSSPTYARSKEINAAAVCERKPNVRVHQLP